MNKLIVFILLLFTACATVTNTNVINMTSPPISSITNECTNKNIDIVMYKIPKIGIEHFEHIDDRGKITYLLDYIKHIKEGIENNQTINAALLKNSIVTCK